MVIEGKIGTPMSGRGYGKPFDTPGDGMRMLLTGLEARAKRYPAQARSAGGGAYGRAMAAVSQAVAARAGYDQAKRDLAQDWTPNPPPPGELRKLELVRDRAKKTVADAAARAQQAMADWEVAVRAKALAHRPVLVAAERTAALARLQAFAPGSWSADQVVGQRIRIAKGALQAGDKALADEAIFGSLLNTIAAVAKQAADPFARPDRRAGVAQDALWEAERWPLIRDLCGPDAEEAIETWRAAEQDTRVNTDLIAHEAGRMIDAEPW